MALSSFRLLAHGIVENSNKGSSVMTAIFSFKGKTVIVTGAARGQGAAEARAFANAGANVVIGDIVADEGEALARDIAQSGGKAMFHKLDVADESDWQAAVAATRARFGGLHILVNNAGVPLRGLDLTNTPRGEWDRVIAINLTGPFLGTKTAAPVIRDSGGGSIVNVGSTAGINGHFAAAYSASKWGLRGLTKCAALEYAGWNIRVNAIHPSIVRTHMTAGSDSFIAAMESVTPLERSVGVEEIADVVMFLASDAASYLTGIDLPVDAGFTDLGVYRTVWRRATGQEAMP